VTPPARASGEPRAAPGERRGETGSVTLELVLWAPALLLIAAVLIVAGRVALAGGAAEHAAAEAARAASLARTPTSAHLDAVRTADASLRGQGLACRTLTVEVDIAGFTVPVGTAATVRATVRCAVALSDIGVPGLSGTRTVSASAVSPLDTYRERG